MGVQILIGFQYLSVFQPGFQRLPLFAQNLKIGGLSLILLALALLMMPAPYHQIVAQGEATRAVDRFTAQSIGIALFPFSLALAIEFYIVVERLGEAPLAIGAGLIILAISLFFWYGWELINRSRYGIKDKKSMSEKSSNRTGGTPLSVKIKQVLTEARMVLPGAQALLGFQFTTMLMDEFDKLPAALKYLHLAGLGCVALSTILLMTPAAYHRLVEQGEDSEHFLRLAGRVIMVAMVFLALGMAAEFYLVVEKVTQSSTGAMVSAGLLLIVFYGLWFGYTTYHRFQTERATSMPKP